MINIIRSSLLAGSVWGGGLMINKSTAYANFVLLMTLLTLWLLYYTLLINACGGEREILHVVLSCSVILALKTKSLMLFYMCFERRVVPTTLILYLYGYQPEKLQASLFLLIYTVIRRLPLLLFIINDQIHMICSTALTLPVTLAFLVKTPIFLLHLWLPKAHVEAPVGGSMVLAGVLLKLGAYGLMLFLPFVKINNVLLFYFVISLIGSSVSSIVCMRQGDTKLLIAYSSVVHMGVVIMTLIRGTDMGYSSAIIMVLAHGLRSPFLFAFSYWLYSSSHSRLFVYCGGSRYMGLFLGLVLLNIGIPPRLSFWSEVFLVITVLQIYACAGLGLVLLLFLGAAYNLIMYALCRHTKMRRDWKEVGAKSYISCLQVFMLAFCSVICLDLFHLYFYSYILITSPIDTNKQKQPNNVYKMPISGSRLKTKMVGSRKMI